MESIADNVARVRERIAAAAVRAGRDPGVITLVAAAKRQSVAAIEAAAAAGVTEIGENYVQEAAEARAQIADVNVRLHLIGHLQSNKAGRAVELFDLIQSVDSLKLARLLARDAAQVGKRQSVLLEVHLGDEPTKSGLTPEQAPDVAAEAAALPGLDLRGLMGVAPLGLDARPYFRQLYALYERLPAENRQILSMGMTGDFESAIEEGATMVRIGRAIFGQRQ